MNDGARAAGFERGEWGSEDGKHSVRRDTSDDRQVSAPLGISGSMPREKDR